jgi:hypothetical protein
MPTPLRIYTAALQKLEPRIGQLNMPWSPVIAKILAGGQFTKEDAGKTPFIEFRVMIGGPGETHQIISGNEHYATGLKDTLKKGNTYGTRLIHAFEIPCADMAKCHNPENTEDVIRAYPERATYQFRRELATQFCLGTENNGLVTLNGQRTYAPDGTALTGLFEDNPRLLQAATVLGLPKEGALANATPGWYHQQGRIASMAANGERIFQQVVGRASRAMEDQTSGVDFMLADETSYYNFLDNRRGQVVVNDVPKGLEGWSDDRKGVKVLGGVMYVEDVMDPASADVLAWGGIIYVLASSTWALRFWPEGPSDTRAFMHFREPQKIPNKDSYVQEIVSHLQAWCVALPCNGLITGGQTP